MVMNPSTLEGRVLSFLTDALAKDTFLVASFTMHEAISTPFTVQLDLVSTETEIDTAAVLSQPAALRVKHGTTSSGESMIIQPLDVWGIPKSIEQCERGKHWVAYRLTLVPRLSRLSLNVRSAVYLDKTVPEIIEEVLKANGMTSSDYEIQTARSYVKREFCVQYLESDLDFVSRLAEHEGIFYFFTWASGESCEKVVFADSPSAYVPILGSTTIPFRADRGKESGWFDKEYIRKVSFRHEIRPKEVILNDYNYRTPSTSLQVTASAAASGSGSVYSYGDHYKDTSEGKTLAQIRAEEWTCREKAWLGESDARAFRAGSVFTMSGHYREDFNVEYLLTEVTHRAEQALIFGHRGSPNANYSNEFTCIPSSWTFRPRRVTPLPKVAGTLNGKIDAAGDGQYAEIDAQGRYKVTLPFDLSGRSGGTASRYLRMAQPYAGAGMGMHFPLHKGTEVVIAFANGDPDRPYIAGAIPNPETAGPVAGANQTQCKVHTGGGNKISMEDLDGSQSLIMYCPTGGTRVRLGAPLR